MKLFKHLRDANKKPYATICATDPDHIGIAICSTKDQFTKKLGRELAEKRAASGEQPQIPTQFVWVRDGIKMFPDGKALISSSYWPIDKLVEMEIATMRRKIARFQNDVKDRSV